jgi:hypothetical protein
MRGFRAKDADRDRHVEVIEAAYVDGQIGDADRELRVSRALSAETLDELETLTRDLQGRPVPVAPRVDTPSADVPRAAKVAVGGLFVVITIVALLVFGMVGLAFMSAGPNGSTTTVVETWGEDVAVPVEEQVDGAAPSFEMTAPEVRRFVRAYEREFGTLEAYDVGFYPTRVGVQVPVRGSRPRFERWTWDGEWTQDTEAAAVTGISEVVDLATLDVRRLFANIATARKSLRVDRGRLTHVLFHRWQGEAPSVNIYIGNSFGESGYLRTRPSGDVVRAYPADG